MTNTSAKYAPNIYSDRTVTFSVRAQAASKVELDFEGPPPTPMTKDSDGVWRITVGPLRPDIYRYTFVIDGVATVDMSNGNVSPGRSQHRSILDIPGHRGGLTSGKTFHTALCTYANTTHMS